MKTQQYPLNFHELEKGAWLDTEALVDVLGLAPADARWSFALMSLVERIGSESGIVARIDHNRIRLMDDAEACEYLARRAETMVRGLGRAAQRRTLINRDALTHEQRDISERRDRMVTAVAMAAHQEMRKQRRIERLATTAASIEADTLAEH